LSEIFAVLKPSAPISFLRTIFSNSAM